MAIHEEDTATAVGFLSGVRIEDMCEPPQRQLIVRPSVWRISESTVGHIVVSPGGALMFCFEDNKGSNVAAICGTTCHDGGDLTVLGKCLPDHLRLS